MFSFSAHPKVGTYDLGAWPGGGNATCAQEQGAAAQVAHRLQVVADEQDRPPAARDLAHLPEALPLEAASPTASTSSTSRISGSRCAATAKASRRYMPLE